MMNAAMREHLDDAQGEALTRPERATDSFSEAVPLATVTDEVTPKEWDTSDSALLAGDQRVLPADPVREVDRRNGNAARARKQAAKQPAVVEDDDGNVHRLKATSLVVPEEKRCSAMTVHGERCKVGKMRGLEVCIFHAHRALSDDSLAQIATEVKPRLSPRKALKAVVALRAEELAMVAVGSALSESGGAATRAVLALVDAVDPLVTEQAGITLTSEGAESATWSQMRQIFSPTG
jgi:hypothetical protein